METVFGLLAFLLFLLISSALESKKPKAKPPAPLPPFPEEHEKRQPFPFAIPEIQGAPQETSTQSDGVYREERSQENSLQTEQNSLQIIFQNKMAEAKRMARREAVQESKVPLSKLEAETPQNSPQTAEQIREAMAWAVVLAPPRARRGIFRRDV